MRVLAERRVSMLRIVLISALALAIWAKAAHAATAQVAIQATPTSGAAPLNVTFTASGDGVTYHWQFGDGTEGDGATVQHMYTTAGRYTATVTSGSFGGGSTGQASVDITAYALSLRAPSPMGFGKPAVFSGTLVPATARAPILLQRNGKTVAHARTNGTRRLPAEDARPRAWRVPGRLRAGSVQHPRGPRAAEAHGAGFGPAHRW